MKNRGILYLFGFGAVILAVGLACGSSSTPTAAVAPTQEAQSTTASAANSSAPVTWTDQDKLFAIDLPGDWTHSQTVDTTKNYWYWDVLTAPDGNAKVESVVYDDGTAWTGSQNGAEALFLLNKFYSNTGKEGDIRVTGDSIQKDGSERLTWNSKGGNYSGVSFFEVRHSTTFLMFTTWWKNDFASKYDSVLNDVVSSYRTP
jgi:hypothetical protein